MGINAMRDEEDSTELRAKRMQTINSLQEKRSTTKRTTAKEPFLSAEVDEP